MNILSALAISLMSTQGAALDVMRSTVVISDADIAQAIVPITLDIEAQVDGRRLWQGQLRTAENDDAGFNQTITQVAEAPDTPCKPLGRRLPSRADSLSLRVVQNSKDPNGEPIFRVSATWVRSEPKFVCGVRDLPQRSVMVTEDVVLSRGKVEEVRGDGGLTIRISRK